MEAKDILDELKDMTKKDEITKNELMVILKKYARIISTYELMLASVRMRQDGQYVQSQYREKYLETYIK